MKKTYYFDMDGVIANFHKSYATDKATALKYDTMVSLEPFNNNIEIMKRLITENNTVYILTKTVNEKTKQAKIDWIKKHIKEFNFDNFICIVGHGNKADYIKEAGILIDDDIKNIRAWKKIGQPTYYVETKGETVTL